MTFLILGLIIIAFIMLNKTDKELDMQQLPYVKRLQKKYGSTEKEVKRYIIPMKFMGFNININKDIAPLLTKINDKYMGQSNKYKVTVVQSFNYRKVTGGTTLSFHAFGRAIDINPAQNPYVKPPKKPMKSDMPVEFVRLFTDLGFRWGGNWSTVSDPMHFDYIADI
jgi:hypothetical protein